jgi:hypothetical protein
MFFLPNVSRVPFKGYLTMIDPFPSIERELMTIETDEPLSANEFYPRPTHAYIRGAQP